MAELRFKFDRAAIAKIKAAIHAEVVAMFQLDIVPEAKRESPVTAEGLLLNTEAGKKRPGGTGTNRRSIDADVIVTDRGPKAELYSQSGYGGYLEVGTSRMRAQPYLYPSFLKFVGELPGRIRARLT